MKTIMKLFFAFSVATLIASCNTNNGSGTDDVRKGSISTQPGQIENANGDSSDTYSPDVNHSKGNEDFNKRHNSNRSKSDSI
jgi:predicted small secreted protein